MSKNEKGIDLESFNIIQKNNYYNSIKKDVNNQIYNEFKYIAIRKIPILFFIFLILCLFLIFYSNNYKHTETKKQIIDKILYLVIGITISISHVYLLSLRTEYRDKINSLYKYEKEIKEHNRKVFNSSLYNSPEFNYKDYLL